MGKTIYISEAQYRKLQEIIKEDESALDIAINPEEGEDTGDAISKAKDNIEQVAGSSVAANANFTVKGNALEGKRYTKKQIEESRLQKIKSEGKVFSKSEFTNYLMRK